MTTQGGFTAGGKIGLPKNMNESQIGNNAPTVIGGNTMVNGSMVGTQISTMKNKGPVNPAINRIISADGKGTINEVDEDADSKQRLLK